MQTKNSNPSRQNKVGKKLTGNRRTARTVKLLLNESVRHLGKVGDVVEVKVGFARNHLIPHNLAVEPTTGNLKRIEEKRKEVERQEKELRDRQAALLKRLESFEVALTRKANERGHLYGSIGASDLAYALNEAGFNEVTADDINLHGKIDRVDIFTAEVKFAEDLKQDFKVIVSPDADSKAAMEEFSREQKRKADEAAAAAAGADAQA